MKPQLWMACGALLAGLAVVSGTFGAHGLKDTLKATGRFDRNVVIDERFTPEEALERAIENYQTACQYQMYHALGLLAVGAAGLHRRSRWLDVAGWCFIAGIGFFSGALYGLAITGNSKLGMVAPVGGGAFILGWLALANGAGPKKEA
jgi:uncharacterized membrane protein YgdD (TMEM256/DUF423 family)